MSPFKEITPRHRDVVDFLLQHNPNWPFGPAMERLKRRYMPRTCDTLTDASRNASTDASGDVQHNETPSESSIQTISNHLTASHEARGPSLPLYASSSNSETRQSPVLQSVNPATLSALGKYDHTPRISPGIVDPLHQAPNFDFTASPPALATHDNGSSCSVANAASPPALATHDHGFSCSVANANPPDHPDSQPANAANPPAFKTPLGCESLPGIVISQDEVSDKQRRPDSPRSRSCSMSLASNSEESQQELIRHTDRRPLIRLSSNDEITVNGPPKEVSKKSSVNDGERPPNAIACKSIVHKKHASVPLPLTDLNPASAVQSKTLQNAQCLTDCNGVLSSPAKRASEQPAYPSKRPATSSPEGLVRGSQHASASSEDDGPRRHCPATSPNHASTSAAVFVPTVEVHLPTQTSAVAASVPPKSQHESLPVIDTRLRLATRIFSYPRNVQEMVLIFCQIGLAHQRNKEWKPNNWPAIGVEEMNRWKHSLERLKKSSDMGFLKDYFQAVKDLGGSHAFQYVPAVAGGPGAILLKDCTPLGLVYRPLIKTLRTLGTRRQSSTTMADLSDAIVANLTKTTPAKLVAGVTSLQTYIEAAERDGIVFVARLSKPNSTELNVRVELTRPWKACQRYSKSFPIDDAKVDLMRFPGSHKAAIEAYQRVVGATRCALCRDKGHYSIECPVPIKSMRDAIKAIGWEDTSDASI